MKFSLLVQVDRARHPADKIITKPSSPRAVGGEGLGAVAQGGEDGGHRWSQGGAVDQAGAAYHCNTVHQRVSPESLF